MSNHEMQVVIENGDWPDPWTPDCFPELNDTLWWDQDPRPHR